MKPRTLGVWIAFVVLGGVAWAVLVVGTSRPALAHAVLTSSEPAPQAILPAASPVRITLRFSEPITRGRIVAYAPNGAAVDGLSVRTDGTFLLGDFARPPAAAGTYTIAWRATSADGHPISGAYVFSLGAPTAPTVIAGIAGADGAGNPGPIAVGVRIVDLVATALAAGLLVLWPLLMRRRNACFAEPRWRLCARAALVVLAVSGCVSLAIQAKRIDASLVSVLGDPFGRATTARTIIAIAALLAISALASRRPLGNVAALAGAGIVLLTTLRGHAGSGGAIEIAADAIHLFGAAAWAAGLLSILVIAHKGDRADAARGFSPVAFGAAVAVAVGGSLVAFQELPRWNNMWDSGYGRTITAKVILFAVILAAAARSRFQLLPRRRDPSRTVTVESSAMVAAIALAGLLTGLAPPPPDRLGPFDQTRTAGPYSVQLSLVPVGAAYEVHVVVSAGGVAAMDVDEITVELREPAKAIGPLRPPARAAGAGHLVSEAVALVPGSWEAKASVRRGQFDLFAVNFAFRL